MSMDFEDAFFQYIRFMLFLHLDPDVERFMRDTKNAESKFRLYLSMFCVNVLMICPSCADARLYCLGVRKVESDLESHESAAQSMAWGRRFSMPLDALPFMEFQSIRGKFNGDCEACGRSEHPASYELKLSGYKYDVDKFRRSNKLEFLEPLQWEHHTFYVGRYCMARTLLWHSLHHWRFHVFREVAHKFHKLRTKNINETVEEVTRPQQWGHMHERRAALIAFSNNYMHIMANNEYCDIDFTIPEMCPANEDQLLTYYPKHFKPAGAWRKKTRVSVAELDESDIESGGIVIRRDQRASSPQLLPQRHAFPVDRGNPSSRRDEVVVVIDDDTDDDKKGKCRRKKSRILADSGDEDADGDDRKKGKCRRKKSRILTDSEDD